MSRRRPVKSLPADSSDDDEPLSNLGNKKKKETKASNDDDSSSESDIENYLQPADKIDLDSPFFNLEKQTRSSFDKIEGDILAGVSRLTDSESDEETNESEIPVQATPSTSKVNFGQLHEYARKMEEAKRHVEKYNAKKKAQNKEMNIENLLLAGESKSKDEIVEGTFDSSDFESCSDSEKEGWEEVEEEKEQKSLIPKEGLQITVDMPGVIRRKTKEVDILASIKRRINRVRKENQVLVHKVHLLCWIAHGNYVNSRINSETVLAVALSLLPSEKCYPENRTDLSYLEQILKWYRNTIAHVEKATPKNKPLDELLQSQITKKEAYDKKMLVYIFIAVLRCLGIQCRLVLSLQVEPLRPPNSDLLSLSTKAEVEATSSKLKDGKKTKEKGAKQQTKSTTEDAESESQENAREEKPSKGTRAKTESVSKKPKPRSKSTNEVKPESIEEEKPKTRSKSVSDAKKQNEGKKGTSNAKEEKRGVSKKQDEDKNNKKPLAKEKEQSVQKQEKTSASIKIKLQKAKATTKLRTERKAGTKRKLTAQKESLTVPQLDGANDTRTSKKPNLKKLKQKKPPCPVKDHPKRLKTLPKYRDSDSEDDFTTTRSPFSNKSNDSPKVNGANLRKLRSYVPKSVDVRNDVISLVKKSIKEQKDIIKSKTIRKRKSGGGGSDNDSDYAPEPIKKKQRESEDEFSPKVKVKKRVQVKKDAEEDEQVKKKQGLDVWAEVFLETEEKWISVDVVKGQVHCVNELYTRASHPVSYIVAWNNDNTLKDITKRYCTNFNTVTRKLRIDQKWWERTIKPFMGRKNARDREEDDELERQQLEKPLPTSITEYKNHPLYVLKRHLLKFEAIYPPDAPTLGFVRGEAVYSRQCVYVLHSRELWLKSARVVKPGEQPYKIVKARPKWDRLSNTVITDQMLEIFGIWQTQDYEPPTAENGVVPRNAFGNVELFKPCMLPKKTVHLNLPGLNKVARRMNIDCAPALTGFDFHAGWNHPVYEGFIVCEEYADILAAAWAVDQEEMEKKEQEKIDKRVYGNWKRLIRGLLIRERLKVKYEFGDTSQSSGKKKKGLPKFATKK